MTTVVTDALEISNEDPISSRPLTARTARTRGRLVRAARALFERRGYLGTSISDITTRARLAHGTFYNYFDSKEDVFAEVARGLQRDFTRSAANEPSLRPDAPLSARIERANRGYLRGYQQNARMMGVLEQVATFNPRLAAIRRTTRQLTLARNTAAIRRWQDEGIVDRKLDPIYAASALGSMVDRSAYVWLVLGEPFELEAATEQLTLLYCNALGLPYHRDIEPPIEEDVAGVSRGRPPAETGSNLRAIVAPLQRF